MIKTDNLYSEVVINESPFYYDENGRLRARVLSEESIRGEKKEEDSYLYRIDNPVTTCLVDKENKGIVFLCEHTEET